MNPEELFDTLSQAKFFTKLDLSKGYWQTPLDIESTQYIAFSMNKGHYHWNYMTFWLAGALMTFTRLIMKFTSGRSDTVSYLDDILLYLKPLEDQLVRRIMDNVGEKKTVWVDFKTHENSDGF